MRALYLLDTNVVSELRKVSAGRADPQVARWQAAVQPGDCFVSVMTMMEIEIGVLRLERRDARQGAALRAWLEDQVRPQFIDRTLAVDTNVAHACAALHVPDPRPERDALIAATALVHGLTVVTRNTADFAATGVPLLDPWRADAVQEPPARYAARGRGRRR